MPGRLIKLYFESVALFSNIWLGGPFVKISEYFYTYPFKTSETTK